MIDIRKVPDAAALGETAATFGAAAIRAAIAARGEACMIVATGASQFDMLASLVVQPDIDWSRVTAFHLDEYVGLPESHPASFRGYLKQRFLAPLQGAPTFFPVDGEAPDPHAEAARLNALIADRVVDVCFAGIGENCHLAFNDPPADFDTTDPYIVVTLDAGCRQQQFGEGWFESLEAVPQRAISMSVHRICLSRLIVLTVPDRRKAQAVKDALEGPVTPLHPASILQRHDNTVLFLDDAAASLLGVTP